MDANAKLFVKVGGAAFAGVVFAQVLGLGGAASIGLGFLVAGLVYGITKFK